MVHFLEQCQALGGRATPINNTKGSGRFSKRFGTWGLTYLWCSLELCGTLYEDSTNSTTTPEKASQEKREERREATAVQNYLQIIRSFALAYRARRACNQLPVPGLRVPACCSAAVYNYGGFAREGYRQLCTGRLTL